MPYREKDTLYREMCEEYLDRDGMTVPPIRPLKPIFPDAGEEGNLLLKQLPCDRIHMRAAAGCNGKKFDLATQARRRRSLVRLKRIFRERFDIHRSESAVENQITVTEHERKSELEQELWQQELVKLERDEPVLESDDGGDWDVESNATGGMSLGYHGLLQRALDGHLALTVGHTDPRHNKTANTRMGILQLLRLIARHSFRQQTITDDAKSCILEYNEKVLPTQNPASVFCSLISSQILFPDPDTQPAAANYWMDAREYLSGTVIEPLNSFELGGMHVHPFRFKRGFRELFCAQELIKTMLHSCMDERHSPLGLSEYCRMTKDFLSPLQVSRQLVDKSL